ncbi:MAG TPA: EamA family transporter [Actinomycetota bacterium]
MTVVLALVTALAWGTTELLMIRAAKGLPAATLGLWLMLFGAVFILPIALWSDPLPSVRDLPIAIAPALIGLAGSFAYWLALRDGMLSIVSPTVATSGGVGAVIAITILGERFSTVGLIGIAVAVAGVVLATFTRAGTAKGVWWAVLAAVLLGCYTVTLAAATERIGPLWSVASYRLTGILVLLPLVAMSQPTIGLERPMRRLVFGAAALETVGFVAFTSALDLGPVAVVAVVTAQFSTVAVVLAAVVLHERLLPHQWVGIAMMIGATTLLGAMS